MKEGQGRLERITLDVNATWREMTGIQEPLDVSEVEVAEHQMLLRTDYRLDIDDASQWVDRVLG